MLAVNIAVLVNERSIQFNDLLKIAMIACDSTLQGDSEHFFIHYYHHPPSYACGGLHLNNRSRRKMESVTSTCCDPLL